MDVLEIMESLAQQEPIAQIFDRVWFWAFGVSESNTNIIFGQFRGPECITVNQYHIQYVLRLIRVAVNENLSILLDMVWGFKSTHYQI